MKKLSKLTTMAMVMALGLAACDKGEEAPLIEQPQVKVENGQMTPEVLNAFGRARR